MCTALNAERLDITTLLLPVIKGFKLFQSLKFLKRYKLFDHKRFARVGMFVLGL